MEAPNPKVRWDYSRYGHPELMAERSFTVDVVTPERVVLSDTATSLVAPGVLGSFGVLPSDS